MDDYKPIFFLLLYLVMAYFKKKKKESPQPNNGQESPQKERTQSLFGFQEMIENLKEEVQEEFTEQIQDPPYETMPVNEKIVLKEVAIEKEKTLDKGSTIPNIDVHSNEIRAEKINKVKKMKSIFDRLGQHSPLAQGVIMAEIIGKPISLRD